MPKSKHKIKQIDKWSRKSWRSINIAEEMQPRNTRTNQYNTHNTSFKGLNNTNQNSKEKSVPLEKICRSTVLGAEFFFLLLAGSQTFESILRRRIYKTLDSTREEERWV